jgi:hypothetical protein
MRAEMAVPDIEEFRQVGDVGEIDLRLDRVLQKLPPASSAGLSRDAMRNSVCRRMSVPFQTALGGR